jgi:putative SOS response-associated peptidase YedK
MCGRYTAAKDFSELIKLGGVIMARMPILTPRYNIAPTQLRDTLKWATTRLNHCP